MPRAKEARKVALDTTVIRHFADAEMALVLATYLKTNGFAAEDVHREIGYQARSRPQLQLLGLARWPRRFGQLPSDLIARGLEIQAAWWEAGDRPDANLGEIYTVLAAAHFSADLIVTDDSQGRALAAVEGIIAIRSGELVAEMVAEESLTVDDGWTVYQLTRKKPARTNYDRLVQAGKAEAISARKSPAQQSSPVPPGCARRS